jgi:hypothetical protein
MDTTTYVTANGHGPMSNRPVNGSGTDRAPGPSTETLLTDFLTQDEAAGELNVCDRTLDRWRRLGEGPPITKLGRRVLYRRSSLQAWLCGREQRKSVR